MGKAGSKLTSKERHLLMNFHNLTEEQFDKIYLEFKALARKKNFISFEEFCTLYSDSRFEHNPLDQLAVFRTLAESERLTLAGFLRLCQLCQTGGGAPDAERLRVLFSVMDEDQSGRISEAEFCRFMANFVDDETTIKNFFVTADEVGADTKRLKLTLEWKQ